MSTVFLKILNMSISASFLIAAVVLVRFALKKAPRWVACLLWALVAVRLVCPFSIQSALSLIPSAQTVPDDIMLSPTPQVQTGLSFVNEAVNPVIAERFTPEAAASANPLQILIPLLAVTWLFGVFMMFVYALISFLGLKKRVSASLEAHSGVYVCDEIASPFILGVFRPRIYVPSALSGEALESVLAHERAHLARRDHIWKPLGFALLALHWFNPLCWLAYVLLCRDIEAACDEKVVRGCDRAQIAAYSQALLACALPRRSISACPLAFGEVGVKARIKGILNYKKPAFWLILAALAVCAVVAVCFLTSPAAELDFGEIESVTVDNIPVSDEAAAELVTLIQSYRRVPFAVGLDDPNSLSRAIRLNCANGDFYLLHYQYYSGFSFDLRHPGEDDYRSILTYFPAEGSGKKAWKMEYDFDSGLIEWLSAFSAPAGKGGEPDLSFLNYENALPLVADRKSVVTVWYLPDEGRTESFLVPGEVEGSALARLLDLAEWTPCEPPERVPASSGSIEFIIEDTYRITIYQAHRLAKVVFNGDTRWYVRGRSDYEDAVELFQSSDSLVGSLISDINAEDMIVTEAFDAESLREVYPAYFDLDSTKGLEVYVWQMAAGTYSCGLLPGTNREKTNEELWGLKGISVDKMKIILASYDLTPDQILVIPIHQLYSSYAYTIDDAYAAQVRRLFFPEE